MILLKPIDEDKEKLFKIFLEKHKELDIEGVTMYNNLDMTITAEAINQELEDVQGKNILIINRTEIVGIPLMLELIKRNATVTIAHSKTVNLNDLILNADILITATGNKKFKIDDKYLKNIETIIDLSNDTDSNKAIRHLKTVDILKARLQCNEYN